MKKYLSTIRTSGMLLMLIGIIMYRVLNMPSGYIACIIGIVLWLTEVIYKAFHSKEYHKDNMQNIMMMLLVIALLLIAMLMAV